MDMEYYYLEEKGQGSKTYHFINISPLSLYPILLFQSEKKRLVMTAGSGNVSSMLLRE